MIELLALAALRAPRRAIAERMFMDGKISYDELKAVYQWQPTPGSK